MRGLHLNSGELIFRDDLPEPDAGPGESRVRVVCAGICATDQALARGYMNFRGVPGHEFVGVALDGPLAGRRVVGEINAACGVCPMCRSGLGRHCPYRDVLGILGRSGAFAERLSLPTENLHAVPDEVGDEQATFTEPVAAAFELLEQLALTRGGSALVIGDGKLGLLCAQVLHRAGQKVTLAGRHPERASLLPAGIEHRTGCTEPDTEAPRERWPLVVEASGRSDVLPRALALVRPRGTLVLKTTTEQPVSLDLASLVVDEITVLGSRCGPFAPALAALASGTVQVDGLVDSRYPLEDGARAFARASEPGVLKVLIHPTPS